MTEGPSEHYSKAPERYEEETKLENLPERLKELLDRFCSLVEKEGEILDAGCGPGRDTEFFYRKGFEAVGIDIAEGMIRHARENREGEFKTMDMRSLGFRDGRFDGIWCAASIFFVPPAEMREIAEELNRVISDDGAAFIGFKFGEGVQVKQEWGGEVKQHLVTESEAREILEGSGWEIIEKSSNEGKDGQRFGNFFCRPK